MICAHTHKHTHKPIHTIKAESKNFLLINMIRIGIGLQTRKWNRNPFNECATRGKIAKFMFVRFTYQDYLFSQYKNHTHIYVCIDCCLVCAWGAFFLAMVVRLSNLSRINLPLYLSNVHKDFPPLICVLHFWLLNHFHLYFFVFPPLLAVRISFILWLFFVCIPPRERKICIDIEFYWSITYA